MCWWDRQLQEKLQQVGIQPILHKRYVDDINLATDALEENNTYRDGELVEAASNGERPNDERTFEVIKEIGNTIHPSIRLTIDFPSKNQDKKVPILDLKCWMQEINGIFKMMHEYYIKKVSSKLVLHRSSAMPITTKRTILTQQCLRIMLNCCDELEESIKNEHLSLFMARMQASGYDHAFRIEVLNQQREHTKR